MASTADREPTSRSVWPLAIVLSGAVFSTINVWHLRGEPLTGILTGVVPPLILSLTVLAVGWLLYVDRIPTAYAPRMATWLALGVLVTGGMTALIVGYELAHGVTVVHAAHIIVNTMSGGAVGGLLIGYYDSQRRRWLDRHRTIEQVLDTIRRVNQRVVETGSHQELFDAICAEFAASDPYVFAWVGTCQDGEIRPVAAAGVEESYLDEIEIPVDDGSPRGPTATAYETGEIQTIQHIRTDPEYEPWRERALEHGFRSSAAVPIQLEGTRYGVLSVYSNRPGAFADRERSVLEELSDAVAHALYRLDVERRQREQYEQLQRENERLDRFASIVSHDLRNPLNVAELHTEMLAEACDQDDVHLDKIDRAHDRMGEIITDTLTLARDGQFVTETEPIHLASIAERCWAAVETTDATLSIASDVIIEADEERLRHLFENLFRNSIDHGGESVTVTVGPLEIPTDDDPPDDATVTGFYVADDGPGIPPAERRTVFEPGHTNAEDGTGLGLSIVRDIVEAHGWEVAITEGAAGGARFEITGVDARLPS